MYDYFNLRLCSYTLPAHD